MAKIKAVFYSPTYTEDEYGEDVASFVQSFTSGVEVSTVTFKDKLAAGQTVNNESVLIHCYKNPNTLSVKSGWKVSLPSQPGAPSYIIEGIDAKYGVQMGLILYGDRAT